MKGSRHAPAQSLQRVPMVAESGQTYYTPRNILITGGAGFIASHVACKLALQYPEYQVSRMYCRRIPGSRECIVCSLIYFRNLSYKCSLPQTRTPYISSNCLLDQKLQWQHACIDCFGGHAQQELNRVVRTKLLYPADTRLRQARLLRELEEPGCYCQQA